MNNKGKIILIIIGFILFLLFQLYLIKEYGYNPIYKITG